MRNVNVHREYSKNTSPFHCISTKFIIRQENLFVLKNLLQFFKESHNLLYRPIEAEHWIWEKYEISFLENFLLQILNTFRE